jgi:hypothetical protein
MTSTIDQLMARPVLITGDGRLALDRHHVYATLDNFADTLQPSVIVTGGGAGIESQAEAWANRLAIPFLVIPANPTRIFGLGLRCILTFGDMPEKIALLAEVCKVSVIKARISK